MQTREEIWTEFWSDTWTAEDGLTRLVPKDKEEPMQNQIGLFTPRNDNGVLFLAYFIAVTHCAGLRDHVRSKYADIGTTIERLIRLPYRGLFNRRATSDKVPDSAERHDNYVGIISLSVLLGYGFHNEIVSYGGRAGWNYNNVHPSQWDLKSQRQGGEIAFYWHSIGTPPGFLEFLWLLGGIISNMWTRDPGKSMLTWLRLFTISRTENHEPWVAWPLMVVSGMWTTAKEWQFGNLETMFSGYFVEGHPIRKMAKHVRGWGF